MPENNNNNNSETERRKMVSTSVTIRQDQEKWLSKKQSFNLSGFVREKIDEEVKKEKEKEEVDL